jgi:hypothetical protein
MGYFRFLACDSLTGARLGYLDLQDVSFSDPVKGGVGSLTGTALISQSQTRQTLDQLSRLDDVSLYVQGVADNEFWWGGPFKARPWNPNDRARTITAMHWKAWLGQRFLGPHTTNPPVERSYSYSQVDQLAISQDVVRLACLAPGAPQIAIGTETSGVLRDLSWKGTDFRDALSLIDSMASRDDGFEWTVDIRPDGLSGLPRLFYVPHFPNRGQEVLAAVFRATPYGGNFTVNNAVEDSSEERRTRVWATGEGEAPALPMAYDEDPNVAQSLTLLTESVTSHSNVTGIKTLSGHARAERLFRSVPNNTIQIKVYFALLDPKTYGPGDRCQFVYQDEGYAINVPAARIIDRSLHVNTGEADYAIVTLDLADSAAPSEDFGAPIIVQGGFVPPPPSGIVFGEALFTAVGSLTAEATGGAATPPVFRAGNAAGGTGAAGGTNATCAMPSGWQVGDKAVFAAVINANTGTITPPAGWAELPSAPGMPVVQSSSVHWVGTRTLQSGDAAPVLASTTGLLKFAAGIVAYQGAEFDAEAHASETTTTTVHTAPAASATVTNTVKVRVYTEKVSSPTAPFTMSGTQTKRAELIGSGGGAASLVMADQSQVATGTTGTETATGTVATVQVLMGTVVLRGTSVPPPTISKPIMGANAETNASFDALNAAAGPLKVRRTYQTNIPASFSASVAVNDPANGRHSIWSWKPNPTTFPADTAQHTALTTFVNSYPTSGPGLTIVGYHEPEDNIAAGTFTMTQWKDTQNQIGDLITATGRTNVRFGICLMGAWTFDTRSPYAAYDWVTGLDFTDVDEILIDPYRWNPGDPSLEALLTVNNSGSGGGGSAPSILEWITARGKPWSLGEWGCTETGVTQADKAAWVTAAYSWMKTVAGSGAGQLLRAAYFHNNLFVPSEPRSTWVLHDEPLAAFAAACADSRS